MQESLSAAQIKRAQVIYLMIKSMGLHNILNSAVFEVQDFLQQSVRSGKDVNCQDDVENGLQDKTLEGFWDFLTVVKHFNLCLVHVVHRNLISILVTDYIQKRRGQALLFSSHYMDQAFNCNNKVFLHVKSLNLHWEDLS